LTGSNACDASKVGPLLDQTAGSVASFTADGAYDQDGVYHEVATRRHRQLVGPRSQWDATSTACPWLCRSGDAGDVGQDLKGLDPGSSIPGGGPLITAEVKKVADPVVSGEETLRLTD